MFVKPAVVLCCLLVAVLADERYTDKYDNIDVKEIMENDRLFNGYVDCAMDRGKCTPEGKEVKNNIQDVLETGCAKCTDTQKEKGQMIVEFLIEHKIAIWKELCAKYDPDGIWRKKYEEEAKKRGIVIPED